MSDPIWSIIIPTRDRATLLGSAIRSAAAQTVDGLEIVISDNASTDETADVVASFDDPRIRRVRTPRSMLMHDSWLFAVDQTRGGLVALLCDDDALHPRALEIAGAALEEDERLDVVYWRACSHRAGPWFDDAVRGTVALGPPCADRGLEVDVERLLDDALRMRLTGRTPLPLMLNCVVRRSLLRRAAEAGTVLFRPSCPDYSSTLALALHARRMVLVDAPLLVAGATSESIGADALRRGERARRFVQELLEGEPDLVMPPATLTPSCWRAQTYLQCAAEWPALAGRSVNLVNTYVFAAREIEAWRRDGVPVDDLDDALGAVLDRLGERGDTVRRLVAAGVDPESDAFLGGPVDPGSAIGIGPFMIGAERNGRRFETAADVAAALDAWLREVAAPLDALPERLAALAGGRRVILYGLGANGRAFARLVAAERAADPLPLAAHDDSAVKLPQGVAPAPAPAGWSPDHDLVIVTPEDAGPIEARLEAAGFVAGRDRFTIRQVAEAGIPSGCRSGHTSRGCGR